jgi:hypothetical protein
LLYLLFGAVTFTAEEYAKFLASEFAFPPEVYKTIEDLANRKKVSIARIVREAWENTSRISGRCSRLLRGSSTLWTPSALKNGPSA